MIARSYLRTPKSMIVQTTALARRKRHEFVRAVAQGLIPPETPPHQRKRKRKHLDVSALTNPLPFRLGLLLRTINFLVEEY